MGSYLAVMTLWNLKVRNRMPMMPPEDGGR
jgi:hypothetical protein